MTGCGRWPVITRMGAPCAKAARIRCASSAWAALLVGLRLAACALQVPEDKDSINGVQQLALEATAVNQNFSQQVRAC